MVVLGSVLLLLIAMVLSYLGGWVSSLRWLPVALLCWCIVIWQCQRRLHLNYSTTDGRQYPRLGFGNQLTLLRGALIAATAGFLSLSTRQAGYLIPFLPALFYSLAAIGDWLDGHLARRLHQSTQLGKELDTVLDALGLLVAPLLAVLYGKLHVSYLLVSISYYLFQWGLYWRRQHQRPVLPLPPSRLRRYLAGIQMGFVAVTLWPPLPAELSRPLGLVFMLPVLLIFWIDWLSVSGRRQQMPPSHAKDRR